MKNKEEWRDVTNYEGLYQVSNLGRVKSFPRPGNYGRNGIKISHNDKGYCWFCSSKNGKQKYLKIHRLVAMAFISNPNNYPQINQKIGINDDNQVENLEWCTHSQNIKHAFDTGLMRPKKGYLNGMAKITKEQVDLIRKLNFPQRKIANIVGLSQSTVGLVKRGLRWNNL